jgi:hypothetical protein
MLVALNLIKHSCSFIKQYISVRWIFNNKVFTSKLYFIFFIMHDHGLITVFNFILELSFFQQVNLVPRVCPLGETLAAAGHVLPRFWEVN